MDYFIHTVFRMELTLFVLAKLILSEYLRCLNFSVGTNLVVSGISKEIPFLKLNKQATSNTKFKHLQYLYWECQVWRDKWCCFHFSKFMPNFYQLIIWVTVGKIVIWGKSMIKSWCICGVSVSMLAVWREGWVFNFGAGKPATTRCESFASSNLNSCLWNGPLER